PLTPNPSPARGEGSNSLALDASPARGEGNSGGKVAVIIPNYRGEHYLEGLLKSLARQTWPDLEVLVVDNDSRDGSEAIVRRFAGVRWIPTGANRGFACAVNHGAGAAGDAEFLAILNNDTEVEPDWARRQVEALRSDPRLGMVGARIYQKGFCRRINIHAHVLGSDLRSYNVGAGAEDHGQFDGGEPVLGVSGCSMMVRARAFREVGGFDQRFFLCYEDLDFSLRLFWRGWDCRVVPGAICHHVSNAQMETGSALHIRNILHNDLLWVVKNIPAELFARYARSFLASVLRSDELRLFFRWQGWKIVLWRLEMLAKLPGALRARAAVQSARVRASEALLPFVRPVKELQVNQLYRVDRAERYLTARTSAARAGTRRDLFPQEVLRTEGFQQPADLAIGAVTAGDDPQIHFHVAAPLRHFRWIDLEMTCDQTSWGQFIMRCRHAGVGQYFLSSTHFRVLPGRHRYACRVDGRFFADHQRMCPDVLGRWRQDLEYLRLDPCETSQAQIVIHSFGVA
ncbi:MAG: glycosyltransferase family 2 protein, partial [Thermoguttaceae bacterium]